jgi:hypothetical protein
MLFLKSTSVTKAPGIYEVDVAAKPPGKTFGVFLATDPDNPPQAVLAALAELGFKNTYQKNYVHKDKGKVLDLHFQKDGTDLFKGWKTEECAPTWRRSTACSATRHHSHAARDEPGRSLRLIIPAPRRDTAPTGRRKRCPAAMRAISGTRSASYTAHSGPVLPAASACRPCAWRR